MLIMRCWASLDCCRVERFCRQQDLAQLVTLLVAQRLDVDLMLGLDLDWTTLRGGVFQLHRVVVPSSSSAAAVPQPEHHDLRVARLAAGHCERALLPPELRPLAAFLNGLQKLRMLLLPVEQRSSRNADPGR